MRRAEVAIVGGGIIGLSIAYHLGRDGVSDVVIYEKEAVGSGASGVAPGGVRRQWATAVSCAMSSESVELYDRIGEILEPEGDVTFRRCGYLFLAHSEAALETLRAGVTLQHRFGIPSRIVAPEDVTEIVPALRTDTLAGASYCPDDGYFDDPWGVISGFARAAQRLGAAVEHAEVRALVPGSGGWELRLGNGTSAHAERVVIAAGEGSASIAGTVGVHLPIRLEPRYLFFSDPMLDVVCEPLVISPERRFAVKQLANGQLMASDLGAGRDGGVATPEAWRLRIAEAAADLLPPLLDVRLTHMVKGFYDMTPDHQPVVGPVAGADNLWLAAGMSGHGFMMAPAIGRGVASMVQGKASAPYFRELGLERFQGEPLTAEAQVI